MMIEPTYHLKWVSWNSGMIPIVMQSINGPCPLIATMNVLLLREKVKLPEMLEQITEAQLLAYIGECIMDSVPPTDMQNDENFLLNLEQNMHDAIEILPKLKSGLDVNIRFTGITDFEYTPECIIFDLLRIPLYHGWLIDPDSSVLQDAIGNQSYNQLVDNIITNKSSQDPVISTKVLVAEEFLERTASQLTVHGLNELKSKIMDNEIGILFRNNHFLTLFKRDGEIYTLVTDHGYLTEFNIVWETLDSIEGAGIFFDANFQLSELANRQEQTNKDNQREQQLVNDYLVALSLKEEEIKQAGPEGTEMRRQLELNDLEIAKRLQEEEDGLVAANNLQVVVSNHDSSSPSAGDQQIATGRFASNFAPNDTQINRLATTSSNATETPLPSIKINTPTSSPLPDQEAFPALTSAPNMLQQESTPLATTTQRAPVYSTQEQGPIKQSLPTSDCVEVVPQQANNVEPGGNQNDDLANNHQRHQEAIDTAPPPLTYATVVDPMRGQKQQQLEDPSPSDEAAAPSQQQQRQQQQQQQQQQASGRNGGKPRSEKSRESTCRVH